MTEHERSSTRLDEERRQPDRSFTERAGDEARSWPGNEEAERRRRMDDRREESWSSRERGGNPGERDWQPPRDPFHGGAPRFAGERGDQSPRRSDYGQGGYWESEASQQGPRQGGSGQGRQEYGQGGGFGQGRQEYGQGGGFGQGRQEYGQGGGFGQGRQEYGQGGGFGQGRQDWRQDFERPGHWADSDRFGQGSWERTGPHTGRGPKGYQRSDDRIKEDLCERLTQHGQIDPSDIEIKVSNREVTLTGTVQSRQAKRMAEDLAEEISGVSEVHNQLRVAHQEQSAQHGQSGAGQSNSGQSGSSKSGKESNRA